MASAAHDDDRLFGALREAVHEETPLAVVLSSALVDRYSVHGEVGAGAQGTVYAASDLRSGARVAIKVLRGASAASPRHRFRFERALELLGDLDHPGIVGVRDHGIAADRLYCVMPWVEGVALDDWAVGRARDAVLRLVVQVCAAVHHAHTRGVIHRDLKPQNVLVDDADRARVLDFGIATAVDRGRHWTVTGEFVGTLAYAAPEQLRGPSPPDTRGDVYALGVMLYQLLAGRLPHDMSGGLQECLQRITEQAPLPLRGVGIDRDLRTIVRTAMHQDAERRYASAEAMRLDLVRYLARQPIAARRDSLLYVMGKSLSRHRGKLVAVGLAVVLAAAGYAVALSHWQQQRSTGTTAAVQELLRSTLAAAGTHATGGTHSAMVLEATAERLARGTLADAPEVKAELHLVLGTTYHRLWMLGPAIDQLREALRLCEQVRDGGRDARRCALALGRAMADAGGSKAVEVLERALAPGDANLDAVDRATAQADLALVLATNPEVLDVDRASRLIGAAAEGLGQAEPESSAVRNRVELYAALIDGVVPAVERERWLERCVQSLRAHGGAEAAATARGLCALASMRAARGDAVAARADMGAAAAVLDRAYGARAPDFLWQHAERARDTGDPRTARLSAYAALTSELSGLAERHPERAGRLTEWAEALSAGAPVDLDAVYQTRIELEGAGRYELAAQMNVLADVLLAEARPDAAERVLRVSLRVGCRVYGDACPHRLRNQLALGQLLAGRGREGEALPLVEEVVRLQRAKNAPDAVRAETERVLRALRSAVSRGRR